MSPCSPRIFKRTQEAPCEFTLAPWGASVPGLGTTAARCCYIKKKLFAVPQICSVSLTLHTIPPLWSPVPSSVVCSWTLSSSRLPEHLVHPLPICISLFYLSMGSVNFLRARRCLIFPSCSQEPMTERALHLESDLGDFGPVP